MPHRWIGAILLALATTSAAPSFAAPPLDIRIDDVARFYRVYDAAGGHPTAQALQADYLDPGSPGLHHLAQIRDVTGETIARAIAAHPQVFADARRCMAVLPRVRPRVVAALARLARLDPQARFPGVTVAVSRGKPAAVADAQGVIVGLEASCAVTYLDPNLEDRFVHEIAHEYTHVQQAFAAPDFYNDAKPTVLHTSLIEGAAEFVATVIARESHYRSPYAPADPADYKAVEERFVAEADSIDLSQWIDNGTLTVPNNLGYWVGYRIARSYYQHARDKRRAIREIIGIRDAKAFLAHSGWYPGIRLDG